MQKRGQFYLAAALIIIVILSGIFIISNSSSKTNDNELQNLQKEMNAEIEKTFDYTINNNLDTASTLNVLNNLSDIYINKTGTNKNTLFIISDASNLTLKGYRTNNSGNFLIDSGSGFQNITNSSGNFYNSLSNVATNITIQDNLDYYTFKIQEGQSFYYLISKNIGEEKVVIRN